MRIAAATMAFVLLATGVWASGRKPGGAAGKAIAVLRPTEGSTASGRVEFIPQGGGTLLRAQINGLAPGSRHGFHIHEFGDCSSPDGNSAGGHFNPGGHRHGGPDDAQRHAGDLGNIQADANGIAVMEMKNTGLALSGAASIVGRAVIVHAGPDDLKTQPTGDAGGRLACGTIGVAKP